MRASLKLLLEGPLICRGNRDIFSPGRRAVGDGDGGPPGNGLLNTMTWWADRPLQWNGLRHTRTSGLGVLRRVSIPKWRSNKVRAEILSKWNFWTTRTSLGSLSERDWMTVIAGIPWRSSRGSWSRGRRRPFSSSIFAGSRRAMRDSSLKMRVEEAWLLLNPRSKR